MGQRTLFIILIALFIIAGVFGVFVIARGLQSASKNGKSGPIVVNKSLISAQNISKDPLVYDGLTVEVEAPIGDWVTKRAFTLTAGGGGFLGGGGQLLVVANTPFKLPKNTTGKEVGLGDTANVHLKGRVEIMDRVELGRALGLDLDGKDIELDDGSIANWTEGSVLILDSVEKL